MMPVGGGELQRRGYIDSFMRMSQIWCTWLGTAQPPAEFKNVLQGDRAIHKARCDRAKK